MPQKISHVILSIGFLKNWILFYIQKVLSGKVPIFYQFSGIVVFEVQQIIKNIKCGKLYFHRLCFSKIMIKVPIIYQFRECFLKQIYLSIRCGKFYFYRLYISKIK